VLLICLGDRQRKLARQQKVAGEASFDSDCVAFGAESIDGLEEENLIVGHDAIGVLNNLLVN
jgi:hypothetical protein